MDRPDRTSLENAASHAAEAATSGREHAVSRRLVLAALAGLSGLQRPAHAANAEAHANHLAAAAAGGGQRTLVDYAVPDLRLVREDGARVSLQSVLGDGRPVILAFIYTSCTTVCPMVSQTLAQVQEMLGPLRDTVNMVSISIDPEFDTPARLREYARRFGAGPQWHHYTGTTAASEAAQRAFNVYRGNKMEHQPATLVRVSAGEKWVRLDGFASARQLITELPDFCTGAKPRA